MRRTPNSSRFFVGWLAACLLASCGKAPEPQPEAEIPPAPEPVAVTRGDIAFGAFPDEGLTAVEIIVVDSIGEQLRDLLLQQRELFAQEIGDGTTGLSGSLDAEMSGEDRRNLEAMIRVQRARFPEKVVLDVDLGNNRLRKYPMDAEVYERYRHLFDALALDNLERGIQFINERFAEEKERFEPLLENPDADIAHAAQATLTWLNQLVEHLQGYLEINTQRVEAMNRRIEARRAAAVAAEQSLSWRDFHAEHGDQMLVEVYRNSLGTTLIEEPGPFLVRGQGILITRLEFGFLSAYLLSNDPQEDLVRFTNIRREKVMPQELESAP